MTHFQFSTTTFEEFIRVLALQVFGPGVNVLGNGPDQGREATFHGTVPYPFPPEQQWNGYGVIQAKFKERLESTRQDQSWALAQLKGELRRWQERNPKPDYLVFCTNVELSPAANGGRERLERVLQAAQKKLRMQGYAIWDANQLRGFVDRYESIRTRFGCLFTPGDVLAQYARQLSWQVDADSVLTAYLCRELLFDQDARLGQSGDRSEDRIKLADVFVDLPVIEINGETLESPLIQPDCLRILAEAAANKLDPLTLHQQQPGGAGTKIHGRFLLIGGPGSGKSTIGQFLAQIHRAALLSRRPEHRLESRVMEVVAAMKARCAEDQIAWPAIPRFPIRIELNAFSQALACRDAGRVATLSEYIRRMLSQDVQISHAELREWLRTYPWLIIFDGLDEVPSSSNRRGVIEAVQHFLNEARDAEADLLVLATTRPEGYHGEFDGDEVRAQALWPLRKREALSCADRYVGAKIGLQDDPRAAKLRSAIAEAIELPLAQRLMTSPLQVTFMVAVIAANGRASESRWQLFADYYRTIYERELHKAVQPFHRVLSERRQDIDALHHRVGFLLQVRGERAEDEDTGLTLAEFEALVDEALRENGLQDAELAWQRTMIVEAARLRLVFLTSCKEDQLGFEVRSLQEYMAAAHITDTDSADAIQRLKCIVHSAYWCNTLLFAIGRFFVEPRLRAHRDRIRLLCEDANKEDPLQEAACLGSRLALEILESGATASVPQISRSLAECALKLLAHPPAAKDSLPDRLAAVYEECMRHEFSSGIAIWLGQRNPHRTLSAWLLLLRLERRGIQWAQDLAESHWPRDPETALLILQLWLGAHDELGRRGRALLRATEASRLEALLPSLPLQACCDLLSRRRLVVPHGTKRQFLRSLIKLLSAAHALEFHLVPEKHVEIISIALVPAHSPSLTRAARIVQQMMLEREIHQSWAQLTQLLRFMSQPTRTTLARCLAGLSEIGVGFDRDLCCQIATWPLASCLAAAGPSRASLSQLAVAAERGEIGDFEDWTASEMRWRSTGIEPADYLGTLCSSSVPLLGAVLRADGVIFPPEYVMEVLDPIIAHLPGLQPSWGKDAIVRALSVHMTVLSITGEPDPDILRTRLLPQITCKSARDTLLLMHPPAELTPAWLDFYGALGSTLRLEWSACPWKAHAFPANQLLAAFCADPTRMGLLMVAVHWAATGEQLDPSPIHASSILRNDHPWAHAILQICRGDLTLDEAAALADQFRRDVAQLTAAPALLDMLLRTLDVRADRSWILQPVLSAVIDAIPSTAWELLAHAEGVKCAFLESRPSAFNNSTLSP